MKVFNVFAPLRNKTTKKDVSCADCGKVLHRGDVMFSKKWLDTTLVFCPDCAFKKETV